MSATIHRVARPHGVLSEETRVALAYLKQGRDQTEAAYRAAVVRALKEGSFAAVSEATGLSTNTLQRWKREASQ